MARVLVVYHRNPWSHWRSTYESHLHCLERFSDHECYYLNTAWSSVPQYLRLLDPDIVIFHYSFLAVRQRPIEFALQVERISFLARVDCPKAIIPHDEQAHSDLLCSLSEEFGVTHVFTPASPPEWPQIYEGMDFDKVKFVTVLTGYVDDATVKAVAEKSKRHHGRPIDIGYRSWDTYPFYGRHGLLKGDIGRVFADGAKRFGMVADISSDYRDAFLGDSWFDFLLKCKYTIGVEGGSSVFDRDGSIAERTRAYCATHDKPAFEEIEAAIFPAMDGKFGYRLLGPRHIEAVMTRTCQVLIEGHYGGTMEPGKHYIELKRDFSNLEDVLALLRDDTLRAEITERAYQDVIASERWTYRSFANLVFAEMLVGASWSPDRHATGSQLVRNRFDNRVYVALLGVNKFIGLTSGRLQAVWNTIRVVLWYESGLGDAWLRFRVFRPRPPQVLARTTVTLLVGEERLWRSITGIRNAVRMLRGQAPIEYGDYVPTEAEAARRERKASCRRD